MEGNADYRAVTLMKANWDDHGGTDITRELNVRGRSTLVMFSRGKEVGRVFGSAARDDIEAMFKAAI